MGNPEIAEILEQTARLLEVHGENTFKVKSYQSAAFNIERMEEKIEGKSIEELAGLKGIGKSLSHKIFHLLQTGRFTDLEELEANTPEGIQELLRIKGIGPKKIAQLWKELDITSPGELLYACNENRLVELKGFGLKSQDTIRKAVLFKQAQKGLYHYATAEKSAIDFQNKVTLEGSTTLAFTGALRRKCEILSQIAFLAIKAEASKLQRILMDNSSLGYEYESTTDSEIRGKSPAGIPIIIHLCEETDFAWSLWQTTGNDLHLEQCLALNTSNANLRNYAQEADIYTALQIPYIEPEMREGLQEVVKARSGKLPSTLITPQDLKGILHNHTTYSDGIHSLREMAIACKNSGYEYLGICDHSRSAQYAGGLSIEKVQQQQQEIQLLNVELHPFRIFSGIESDILADGSLDYPDEILTTFDFVVASVHSGLKMDIGKATQRILKAIENPFTTILGHPTGRLLLSREGYPLDFDQILKACAEHDVVIELNAHPYRLDLDWRLIDRAMESGIQISINPDAHSVEGYVDMYYGVCTARKGGLTPDFTFNRKNLTEITEWFEKRKAKHL